MDDSEIERWDELNPDAWGIIFRSLSLEQILVVIPSVCKSWREIVLGPYFWQEIDIMNWSEHRHRHRHPDIFNRVLQMVITRSTGSLLKLCVSRLPNDSSLALIAVHGKALQTLRIPRSKITNSIVELVAKSFSAVTFLDLSFCPNIGATAIEAIGKHCVNLTSFIRSVMYPIDERSSQDDEALAIASTMHKLKHLDITNNLHINAESLLNILENCQELEYVDLEGCLYVTLDEKFRKFSRVKLVGLDSDLEFGPELDDLTKMCVSEDDEEFDFDNGVENWNPFGFGGSP